MTNSHTVRFLSFLEWMKEENAFKESLKAPIPANLLPNKTNNKSEFIQDPFFRKYLEENKDVQRGKRCAAADKKSFETKTQARNYRREAEKMYGKFYRIYACEECGKFHLATVESKYSKNK